MQAFRLFRLAAHVDGYGTETYRNRNRMIPDSPVHLKCDNTSFSANRLWLPRDPETLRLQRLGHPSTPIQSVIVFISYWAV